MSFESYYQPLADFIRWARLDGIDLDVEEPMSLPGIIRLVLRLRADFGPDFLITLAPVAAAMCEEPEPEPDFERGRRKKEADDPTQVARRKGVGNLSGFSYQDLEKAVGNEIAWYNTQFYCGWGDLDDGGEMYRQILEQGWDPTKIVVGTVTNPINGAGWTAERSVKRTLKGMVAALKQKSRTHDGRKQEKVAFGGMMGWEYYNCVVPSPTRGFALHSGEPWLWARRLRTFIDAAVNGDDGVLQETWDEKVSIWDGKFNEAFYGAKDSTAQNKQGKWNF
jgi:hypothetical protein